jgi:tyrosinase
VAKFTRRNAWNNSGTFDNKDLYWYAIGVRAMMNRALDDPASWWFFAAIHGEYVTPQNNPGQFPGWGSIPGQPHVPTTPLPAQRVIDTYWDQCQHQSWFFAPWHRGYLAALEAQLREDIKAAGGPADWALPYWNYFGPGNQFDIPPAFTQSTMPDGSANPLFVTARYGPNGDGVVFVPTPAAAAHHSLPPNSTPVTDTCLNNTVYTGSDANTPLPGFGGPLSGFWHGGNYPSGNLEQNPHNLVHVYVGGFISNTVYGLMADPGTAGLDPIFFLHHANIDRMWAVWNATSSNTNPTDPTWLNGPAASGEHEFVMPMPGNQSWTFAPKDVTSLSLMDYTYDDLTPPPAVSGLEVRMKRLGRTVPAGAAAGPAGRTTVELVGSNETALPIRGASTSTTVRLDPQAHGKVRRSLAAASTEAAPPDRVYLNLENVRGTQDATVLSVFVNLPEGADPANHPELLAGTVALFGLRRATTASGQHVGGGLNFLLDISAIVDQLHLAGGLDTATLRVTIVPDRPLGEGSDIVVGRVSVYREGR